MDEAPGGHAEEATAPRGGGRTPDAPKPRRRTSFVGVIGEILVTVGIVTLLYVGWQLWIGDMIYGAERNATGQELSQTWAEEYVAPLTRDTEDDEPAEPVTADPVVLAQPADGQTFGIMRIPRFGADYAVPIAGGITRSGTLDNIGIGHYPGTKMPGEVGNFALAAHRTTYGKPFNRIADLRVNDAIVIETADGWYTYRFRTLEYVSPNASEVLLPVPQEIDAPAGTRYITMTSCSPMYAMSERIIAYGVFESFTPRSAGEPPSITEAAA